MMESSNTKCDGNPSPAEAMAAAEAEYHQVVENAELFWDKLRKFHSSFGTKQQQQQQFLGPGPCISISIPISKAGTCTSFSLNLHRLFVEVTSRGGLHQVVRERKLEEVTCVFDIPTTTGGGGSFILRKCYLSLLLHFEQLYFFRKAIPLPLPLPLPTTTIEIEMTPPPSNMGSPQICPGVSLVGVIDEKFDNGYVVTVNVGSEQLKGILYHTPDKPQPSWNGSLTQSRKRKKSRLTLLDSSKPKLGRNIYNLLSKRHGTLNPMSEEHPWNKTTEFEKKLHQGKENVDNEHDTINLTGA